MSETADRSTERGVLRPFVEPEFEPLPVDEPLPPPVRAGSAQPTGEVTEAPPGVDGSEAAGAGSTVDEAAFAAGSPVAETAGPATAEVPAAMAISQTDTERTTAMGLGSTDDSSPNALVPDLGPEDRSITLGRAPFLIGLGVLLLAIVVLAFLWRSAGGDSSSPTIAADIPTPVDSDGVVIDTSDADALAQALADEQARADGAEQRASDLETRVTDLEEQLADQPVPALPASALERVIVSADAQFVSATDAAVAVVGPFGGYSNIDPMNNTVTASGQIGPEATRVLRTGTTVWATNHNGNELIRLDPVTDQVVARIEFPGPDGLAKYGDKLLVASFTEGFVGLIDPVAGVIEARADVGGSATAVLAVDDRIYVGVFETGEVVKIDPETFEVIDRAIVGAGPVGLLEGSGDRVWVTNRSEGTVARIDFETDEIVSIPVGDGPVEVAWNFGSLWVAVADAGELVQIDVNDQSVVTRTPLGGSPTGLSVGAGSLWVAVSGERSVVRVTL